MLDDWNDSNEAKRSFKRSIRIIGKNPFIQTLGAIAITELHKLDDSHLSNTSDRYWPMSKRVSILVNNIENAKQGTIEFSYKNLLYDNLHTIVSGLKPEAKSIIELSCFLCQAFHEGKGWEKHLMASFSLLNSISPEKVKEVVREINEQWI